MGIFSKRDLGVPRFHSCPVALIAVAAVFWPYETALGEYVTEGFAEPYRTVQVASPEPGIVAEVHVREGSRVAKGDLLVELDTGTLEIALAIAKTRRDATGRQRAAHAELTLRAQRRAKLEELLAKGNASLEEVDRAIADEEIAAATLASVEEDRQANALEVDRIAEQIDRLRVRAPLDGRVTRVLREPSEHLSLSQPGVVTLVQLNPLRVVMFAPIVRIEAIQEKEKVTVRFTDLSRDVDGTVEYISPVSDAQSGTVEVHIVVPNGDESIRGGSRCSVRWAGDRAKNADDTGS